MLHSSLGLGQHWTQDSPDGDEDNENILQNKHFISGMGVYYVQMIVAVHKHVIYINIKYNNKQLSVI